MAVKATQPATILVVDDFPANRLVLERHLIRLGHQVMLADHGREAIEMLRAHTIDLILLDIMMPVMNGFETLTILKSDPLLRHLPVVVVSALNDVESVARCISLGAEDFLFKPVERVLLDARVDACLERKRLRDREQAAYAAAEAANRAKGAFVSMVSHELKNSITGIAGYADMMMLQMLGPLTDLQGESVRAIRSLTSLMVTLLNDLTDLSMIESGHLRLELAPITVREALESAGNAVRMLLAEREHRLTIELPKGLPTVLADRVRLSQILTNLLSNAAKYTPPGGLVTLSAWQPGAKQVQVDVRDSGIGIATAEQGRIFEPFFRSTEARIGAESGTGLGLSITRHLVELQGGKIWFTSVQGEGTTFSFTLPVADSGDPPESAGTHPSTSFLR